MSDDGWPTGPAPTQGYAGASAAASGYGEVGATRSGHLVIDQTRIGTSAERDAPRAVTGAQRYSIPDGLRRKSGQSRFCGCDAILRKAISERAVGTIVGIFYFRPLFSQVE